VCGGVGLIADEETSTRRHHAIVNAVDPDVHDRAHDVLSDEDRRDLGAQRAALGGTVDRRRAETGDHSTTGGRQLGRRFQLCSVQLETDDGLLRGVCRHDDGTHQQGRDQ
jgi:hypothetical protein